jgi:hypothetical protein
MLLLAIGLPASNALAQQFQVQVIVEQLNVRPEPPRFALSTLINFKYQVPAPVQALGKGSILRVHEVRKVGKAAEWLNITYTTADGKAARGWVYAGRVGHWVNVRRIDGHGSSHPADSTFALFDLLDFLVVPAHAAGTDTAGEGSDIQGIQANPLYVLFVIAFNLALFLGSMFIGKKIVNNTRFVMFTGVCTLLIEGVVTEAGLWGWLEGII